MQIEDYQAIQGLKVADVAGQEREAVDEGRGGDDGVGELDAVLLAQADGLLGDGLTERQYGHALHENLHHGVLCGGFGFRQQFDACDNGNSYRLLLQLLFEPTATSRWQTTNYQINNDIGIR